MPLDIEELLAEALGKVRGEKERDELERRFSDLERRLSGRSNGGGLELGALVQALNGLTDEELERLERDALAGLPVEDPPPPAGGSGAPPAEPPAPTRRTRQGRRTGQVYAWDVDDDGELVELPMGKVYSGPDEPDEVELPEKEEPPEEPEEVESVNAE